MKKKSTSKAPRAAISPELVAEAKAGDQAAFAELYEQTSAGLYRSIRSMVRDEDLAWDILQDSYLQAFRDLGKLEANEAFLSWLRRIAVTTTAKAMNRRQLLTFTELGGEEDEGEPELPDPDPDTQPELALDRKESARLVRELLKGLPEQQQLILGMRYYEDMPVREIAELLGVAPGTVKAQLCFGRKKVEAGVRALEKRGVKLYGLSPLPFLLALLRRLEPGKAAEQKALAAVLAKAPAAGGTAAVTVTAMTAGQALLHGLGAKLLAGALAVAVLVGGGKLAYDALKKGGDPPVGPERPTAEAQTVPPETAEPAQPVLPEKHYAPEDTPENACGPDLTWRYDEDTGTLTIEGSGEMYDYGNFIDENKAAPWDDFNRKITSVQFPDELTSIGDYAFYDCFGLESLTLPAGVRSIGEHAFSYCEVLSSVTFPESVTSIGKSAFYYCVWLRSVTIPEGVSTIEDDTFCGCSGLTSVTIPGSVTSIGDSAFSGCSGLTSVTFPESVISIGKLAFQKCAGLTRVTIPERVTAIGGGAFADCSGLEAFSVHPANECFSVDESGVLYNKDYSVLIVFPAGKSEAPELPGSVNAIGDYAFSGCRGLRSLTLPAGVRSIGEHAFSYCEVLSSVTFPESVTSIGKSAFYYCVWLRSVTIPKGVSTIEDDTFRGCSFLRSVTIPEGVTSIGRSAFENCSGLRSVTIPESAAFIGVGAFTGCTGLEAFSVHPANERFGADENGALYNKDDMTLMACPGGKSGAFVIQDGVRSIGDSAFDGCSGLTSVTIPDSVRSIGEKAFYECSGLRSVTIPENVSSIGKNAFHDCSGLTSVTIPDSVSSIGDFAFSCCFGLTSVTIPESVRTIGKFVFLYCPSLTIRGVPGSEAERCANESGRPFEAIP